MAIIPEDRQRAEALKLIRKAKGFRSGQAAAEHHGWPVSRYRSHESGTRPILEPDVKRYAAGFGIDWLDLLQPWQSPVAEMVAHAHFSETERRRASERLHCARVLRGYGSIAEVCRQWEIAATTMVAHERGINLLSDAAARMYAEIFGVRHQWLLDGVPPSSLGPAIDAAGDAALRSPLDFLSRVAAMPLVDGERVKELRNAIAPGRPALALVGIAEYDSSDIEASDGIVEATNAAGTWNVPVTFLSQLDIAPRDMFVVAVTKGRAGIEVGERLFVSLSKTWRENDRHLICRHGAIAVSDRQDEGVRIGVILGRLQGPAAKKRT